MNKNDWSQRLELYKQTNLIEPNNENDTFFDRVNLNFFYASVDYLIRKLKAEDVTLSVVGYFITRKDAISVLQQDQISFELLGIPLLNDAIEDQYDGVLADLRIQLDQYVDSDKLGNTRNLVNQLFKN